MNWIYKGLVSALAQLSILAAFLIVAAGALWSCSYIGISPGYGLIAFYTVTLLSVNLFFSWLTSRDSKTVEVKVEE